MNINDKKIPPIDQIKSMEHSLQCMLDDISDLRCNTFFFDMKHEVGNEPYFSKLGNPLVTSKELVMRIRSQSAQLYNDLEYIIENGEI